MEWVQYPYIAKATKTGKLQLAVNPNKNTKYVSKWYMNGVEVEKKDIESYLYASEKNSGGKSVDVFRIGLENVIEIR